MAKFFVCVITALIAARLIPADATGERMICQAVADVCSGEGVLPTRTRLARGPAGKMGPKGDKGDVGAPGPSGTVDQNNLKALVAAKVNAATNEIREDQRQSKQATNEIREDQRQSNQVIANLRQQITVLQQQVRTFNATISKIEAGQAKSGTGPDQSNRCRGFTFQSKCYFTVIRSRAGILFNEAKSICTEQGAKLADIHNLSHENLVQNLMRKNMRGSSIQVWVGMTFKVVPGGGPMPFMLPPMGIITQTAGKIVNTQTYRWNRSYPSLRTADTNILIEATSTAGQGGMLNRPPNHSGSSGALCMKQKAT